VAITDPSYFWQDIAQRTKQRQLWLAESERRADFRSPAAGSATPDAGEHEIKAGVSYYSNSYQLSTMYTGRNTDPFPGNGFDDGTDFNLGVPGAPIILMEYQSGLTKDSTRGFGCTCRIRSFSGGSPSCWPADRHPADLQ